MYPELHWGAEQVSGRASWRPSQKMLWQLGKATGRCCCKGIPKMLSPVAMVAAVAKESNNQPKLAIAKDKLI